MNQKQSINLNNVQPQRRKSNLTSNSQTKPVALKDNAIEASGQQIAKGGRKRDSMDGTLPLNSATTRRSSKGSQNYPELLPAKTIDNFLKKKEKKKMRESRYQQSQSEISEIPSSLSNTANHVQVLNITESDFITKIQKKDSYSEDIHQKSDDEVEDNEEDYQILNNEQNNTYKYDEPSTIIQDNSDSSSQQSAPVNRELLFPVQHIQEQITQQIGNSENKILSLRYDSTDTMVACASVDGIVRIIFDAKGLTAYTLQDVTEKVQPATCVRWKPDTQTSNVKNTLLATYSGGKCLYWHTTSQQILTRYEEDNNDINTCDFTLDGNSFITAGSDSKVRLYEVGKKKAVAVFTTGACSEHKNRIYASKFANQNLLITAGWDQNALLWDLRTRSTQGYIYGPMICGDSLDCQGDTVLTGSWRSNKQLQLWDLRKTNKPMVDIVWEPLSMNAGSSEQSFIYSCQFSKSNSNYILAGATGTYEMRLFDRQNNYQCIDALTQNINGGVFALDFANNKSKATYGTSNGRWARADIIV